MAAFNISSSTFVQTPPLTYSGGAIFEIDYSGIRWMCGKTVFLSVCLFLVSDDQSLKRKCRTRMAIHDTMSDAKKKS